MLKKKKKSLKKTHKCFFLNAIIIIINYVSWP